MLADTDVLLTGSVHKFIALLLLLLSLKHVIQTWHIKVPKLCYSP